MIKPKPIIEIVEMSVAEAVDLHERAWIKIRQTEGSNFFKSTYHFKPFCLSELIARIDYARADKYYDEAGENYYTDGNLYVARKNENADTIEIKKIQHVFANNWDFAPRKVSMRGSTRDGSYDSVKIYQLFAQIERLNLESATNYSGSHSFFIPADGKANLEQISNLPIWDKKEDYEVFLNSLYGKEKIHEKLKSGEKFDLFEGSKKVSNIWKIIIAGLSFKRYNMSYNAPFKLLDETFHGNGKFTSYFMLGQIEVERKWGNERTNNLHKKIIEDYVQPKNLGNGIIVLSEDRIPKYLRRILGI